MSANSGLHQAMIVLAVLGSALHGPSVLAQCDPPAAGTKCWTGEENDFWSHQDNWNPAVLPQSTDTVYHLIGGPIQMNTGDASDPVEIAAFRFGSQYQPFGSAIAIQADRGLDVADLFTPTTGFPQSRYFVRVEDGALLRVGTRMENVDVSVLSGSGQLTIVDVGIGQFANGTLDTQPGTITYLGSVDLPEGPVASPAWDIEGTLLVSGSVTGYGRWNVRGDEFGFESVAVIASAEFSSLSLESRLCLKTSHTHQSQISLNERHLDHATEVLGRLLEPGEEAAALFEPADQTLNDISLSVRLAVKDRQTGVPVFVVFRGDHRLDFQCQEVIIDPVGPVALVTRQSQRPGHRSAFLVEQLSIGVFQKCVQDRRFVGLAGRQMEVKRMPLTVAQKVDFRGKAPARAA